MSPGCSPPWRNGRSGVSPPKRLVAVVAAFLVVLVAATPQGRAAVVEVLRFAGVEIEVGTSEPLPSGSPSPLPSETERRAGRGPQDGGVPAGRTRPRWANPTRSGWPTAVRSSACTGTASASTSTTAPCARSGTSNSANRTPSRPWSARTSAMWIPQQHGIEYLPSAGGAPVSLRLAGPTLIWQSGRVGLRLEGVATVDEATRIAASVR